VKDHLTLIRAWSLAHEACPGWTLRIVGEGPLRGVLEDEVSKLGVEGSVEFAGYREDVAVEYAASSVFVLPSLLEGFSNVLVEAMAAGCACVATACPGGPKEILGFGRHGLLVEPANPEQLAEALLKLVKDPEERARLGLSAQDRAKEFAPSRVLAFWTALVERAVASARSGTPRGVS
jgi:glycosyltransferase involved in cell wall biosynthesis